MQARRIDKDNLVLVFGFEKLDNEATLSDCGVKQGSTLLVYLSRDPHVKPKRKAIEENTQRKKSKVVRLIKPTRQADGNATRTHGDKEFVQPKEGMLSVDFAKAAGRAFWMSECLNASRTPDFDGCFS